MSRLATGVLAFVVLASAGASAAPRFLATNMPEVHAVAGPPAGFDPVRASDEERASYGFPPPPDAVRAPESYAHWARAMRASRTRIVPKLAVSAVRHGAMRPAVMHPAIVHGLAATSSNWSGAVQTSSATSFGPLSYWIVGGNVTVPVAAQPFNSCTGGWLYDSAWFGLDGAQNYSSDVLQAGIDADAYCANGYTATNYDVWYEWAPGNGVTIQNMPVQPGDEIYFAVWALSPTQGAAFIVNDNTGQSAGFTIDPPAGTKLIGNSAEFITERPEVNNKLANLARYTLEIFTGGYIENNQNAPFFAGGPSLTDVTMLDNNGQPISVPHIVGGDTITILDEGSAQ